MIYKTRSLCYNALSKAGYFLLSGLSLVLCKASLPRRRNISLPACLARLFLNTHKTQEDNIILFSNSSVRFNTRNSSLGLCCLFVLTTGLMRWSIPQALPFQSTSNPLDTQNSTKWFYPGLTNQPAQWPWRQDRPPLTLAVLAVSNMPCAYLTVSVSFCQFAFYPLSWLPSRNSKRPLMKTGSDASFYPLSSHPSARECFRTQTHDTHCTNEKNRSSLINSTDQYELLQPLNTVPEKGCFSQWTPQKSITVRANL